MIQHHAQFSYVGYPSGWSKPRFEMGQRVQVDHDDVGTITGVEYIAPDSYLAVRDVELGWHYTIFFDRDAKRYAVEPFASVYESDLTPVQQLVQAV